MQCADPNCDQLFHYPCAISIGCFQNIKSRKTLCPGHIEQATKLFDASGNKCALCDNCERLADMLFCTTCGQHYHGSCLQPAVSTGAMVRVGWQCAECKVCMVCKQTGDDTKTVVCEACDKCAHSYCLKAESLVAGAKGWRCGQCRFELVTKQCTACSGQFVMPKADANSVSTCEECDLARANKPLMVAAAAPVSQPIVSVVEKKRSSVKELLLLSKMQSLNGKCL